MSKSEAAWNEHRTTQINLVQQFDYYGKLAAQFPLAPLRVVYAKAGTQPAASIVRDKKSIAENLLYRCPVATGMEGEYLCAIINSETARKRIELYQARGQWGARHFDKVIFNLPIPRFDPKNKVHAALSKAAAGAEEVAAAIDLPADVKFQRATTSSPSCLTGNWRAAKPLTRPSSEEGLEMEFNSLDAQREPCEAYIASQKPEGWMLVPDRYDDGGVSGRPALKRLVADIERGQVDVVVVYNIDRLSPALENANENQCPIPTATSLAYPT